MKITSLEPRELPDGSWTLNVPPAFSSNGCRRRLFFSTKGEATKEADRLKRIKRHHGTKATVLPAHVAQDAAKAMALLAGRDMTLTALAHDWLEREKLLAASVPFSECWAKHMENISRKSERYNSDAGKIGEKIMPILAKKIVVSITSEALEQAIGSLWRTPVRFNTACSVLRPAFTLAVRKGWATSDPFEKIDRRDPGRREIEVLSLKESEALMAACRDHRSRSKTANTGRRGKAAQKKTDSPPGLPPLLQVDATDAAPAVAVLLFAGVRPAELERLTWDDVRWDHGDHGSIRISGLKSKTGATRFIPMEANLKAWLDQVPPGHRQGPICPKGWKRKWQAVRKVAGIGNKQDVCRHTFGTMWLAAFEDVNTLRARMGHNTKDVLFNHYTALATKKDGLAYFGIIPTLAAKPALIRKAAVG